MRDTVGLDRSKGYVANTIEDQLSELIGPRNGFGKIVGNNEARVLLIQFISRDYD